MSWSAPSLPSRPSPARVKYAPTFEKSKDWVLEQKNRLQDLLNEINSIYATNDRAKQMWLAIILAMQGGRIDATTTTNVPFPSFEVPSDGVCPAWFVKNKATCIPEALPTNKAGLARLSMLLDSLDAIAYEGNSRQFVDELYKNSDARFLSPEDRADFEDKLINALTFLQSDVGETMLWDTASLVPIQGGPVPTELSRLPSQSPERIKRAAEVLTKLWPASWASNSRRRYMAVLAMGLMMSNFGLVDTNPEGQPEKAEETNNWLKVGPVRQGSTCPAGTVFDKARPDQCVVVYSSVNKGIEATLASLNEPESEPLLEVIDGGDIGELAWGMIRAGYLRPAPADKITWTSTAAMLATAFAALDLIVGQTDWKKGSFAPVVDQGPPELPDGGQGDVGGADGTDGSSEKKGMSTGAKVALGVAGVAILGAGAWMLSRPSSSTGEPARASNPRHDIHVEFAPVDPRNVKAKDPLQEQIMQWFVNHGATNIGGGVSSAGGLVTSKELVFSAPTPFDAKRLEREFRQDFAQHLQPSGRLLSATIG